MEEMDSRSEGGTPVSAWPNERARAAGAERAQAAKQPHASTTIDIAPTSAFFKLPHSPGNSHTTNSPLSALRLLALTRPLSAQQAQLPRRTLSI